MCNKNVLTVVEKVHKNTIHNVGYDVTTFSTFLNELVMYCMFPQINSSLSFQNCFGVLCLPGKALSGFSHFKYLRRQHNAVSRATCRQGVAGELGVEPACFKFCSELIASSRLRPFMISIRMPTYNLQVAPSFFFFPPPYIRTYGN
jgi:hypothetical protein